MGEGLVGLGHAVDFLALLHRAAAALGRFHQLTRQAGVHGLLAALLRRLANPAHRQRRTTYRADLDGDLVVRAAHAPALDLDHGLYVLHRLAEDLERVL